LYKKYTIEGMKKIITLFLLLTFLMLCIVGKSQSTTTLESLEIKLKTSKQDTNKINILNSLSEKTEHINPNLALKYGEEALKLAEKLIYKKGIAEVFINIVYFYYYKG